MVSVKKAFHTISLEIHPDRISSGNRKNATEKFKILAKLYAVLTNKKAKNIYDRKGDIIDVANDLSSVLPIPTFLITATHINKCKQKYSGNE